MKTRILASTLLAMLGAVAVAADEKTGDATARQAQSPLDFKVADIDGKETDLSRYKGKVVLLVNVASKCGLTPQYEGLQKLYDAHKDKGLVVVGFPANDFKGQEPGTNEQIKEFCTGKYNVTFPMMSKVAVLGPDKAPLYKFLTEEPTAGQFAGDVKWNFTKFLVGRDGKVVARFEPKTKPTDPQVTEAIEKALQQQG